MRCRPVYVVLQEHASMGERMDFGFGEARDLAILSRCILHGQRSIENLAFDPRLIHIIRS